MRSRDLSVRETSLRLWSGNVKLVVSDKHPADYDT